MSNYIVNAYKTLKSIYNYIDNWYFWDDVEDGVSAYLRYNWNCNLKVDCGSSRIVIIGKDFVIKWDYDIAATNSIGGCEEEVKMYNYAKKAGYAHLFAKISCIYYKGRFFYVMPRINNIGMKSANPEFYLTKNEYEWLVNHVNDLHSFNYGFMGKKLVMIDYACISIPL